MTPLHAVLVAITGIALAVAGVVMLWGVPVGLIAAGVWVVVGAVILYDPNAGKPS